MRVGDGRKTKEAPLREVISWNPPGERKCKLRVRTIRNWNASHGRHISSPLATFPISKCHADYWKTSAKPVIGTEDWG